MHIYESMYGCLTHKHIYICLHIYIYVCVCVCVCVYMLAYVHIYMYTYVNSSDRLKIERVIHFYATKERKMSLKYF